MNNIRRRIRDPNQRNEIIAHYNANRRDVPIHDGKWEYPEQRMYPVQYRPTINGISPLNEQYITPNNEQVATRYSTRPNREQFMHPFDNSGQHTVTEVSYPTQPSRERSMHPFDMYEYKDPNLYNHSDIEIAKTIHHPTTLIDNITGQTNGWYEPYSCGIPQFQRKWNTVSDSTTTFGNGVFRPSIHSTGNSFINPPSTASNPIVPFDNFISPSEQINSISNVESIADQTNFDNDWFHDSIYLEKENTSHIFDRFPQNELRGISIRTDSHDEQPFDGFHVEYDHRILGSNMSLDEPLLLSPPTSLDLPESPITLEVFNMRSWTMNQPLAYNDQYPNMKLHSAEAQNKGIPQFQTNHNLGTNQDSENTNYSEFLSFQENCVRGNEDLFSHAASEDIMQQKMNPTTQLASSPLNSVRNPKPYNRLPYNIRFFNEGIEVDLHNRPLLRPHSSTDSVINEPPDFDTFPSKVYVRRE
jgi:hypothetical protein